MRPVDHDLGPPTPYVGVRAYTFGETGLFAGRDADVASVADLVADKESWRLILLHGMSGAGKSSFLKAGLIPEVTSAVDTAVFERSGDGSYSTFITSTAEPLRRVSEAAVELAHTHLGQRASAFFASQDLAGNDKALHEQLASSPERLAQLFDRLAPHLRRPLLLVIDQAEELFTLRVDQVADTARDDFFDFLALFCSKSTWIQILVSMRTEFYGRFDAELRRRIGADMPVAPYFLRSMSTEMLEQVILQPCERVFTTLEGMEYRLHYRPGVAARIAGAVVESFPGPGALTCLQIVCVRLYEQALAQAEAPSVEGGPRLAVVTQEMVVALGPLASVIEDVIDQAIGRFCDEEGLTLADSLNYWRACKTMLGRLVKQSSEGAPVTTFLLHQKFGQGMFDKLWEPAARTTARGLKALFPLVRSPDLSFPETYGDDAGAVGRRIDRLTAQLLLPANRVLRDIHIVEPGRDRPSHFVALGHDVLAVGLAEAAARENLLEKRRSRESRNLIVRMILVPLALMAVVALAMLLVPTWRAQDLSTWSSALIVAALVGFYASLVVDIFRTSYQKDQFHHVLRQHLTDAAPDGLRGSSLLWLTFKAPFVRLPHVGSLMRRITDSDRRKSAAAGVQAFPGGARF